MTSIALARPLRPGLPAMRSDAPFRLEGSRLAALPSWADEADRRRVLHELHVDALAASTRKGDAAKIRTIYRALRPWGLVPFPP